MYKTGCNFFLRIIETIVVQWGSFTANAVGSIHIWGNEFILLNLSGLDFGLFFRPTLVGRENLEI